MLIITNLLLLTLALCGRHRKNFPELQSENPLCKVSLVVQFDYLVSLFLDLPEQLKHFCKQHELDIKCP